MGIVLCGENLKCAFSISIHLSLVTVTNFSSRFLSLFYSWSSWVKGMGLWPRVIPISIVPRHHGSMVIRPMTQTGLIRANLRTFARAIGKQINKHTHTHTNTNAHTHKHTHTFFSLLNLNLRGCKMELPNKERIELSMKTTEKLYWVMCKRYGVFMTLFWIWIKLFLNPDFPSDHCPGQFELGFLSIATRWIKIYSIYWPGRLSEVVSSTCMFWIPGVFKVLWGWIWAF